VAGCATPTGSAGHAGATANLKLTFHLDHSAGADHLATRNLSHREAHSGSGSGGEMDFGFPSEPGPHRDVAPFHEELGPGKIHFRINVNVAERVRLKSVAVLYVPIESWATAKSRPGYQIH
jgi:hypothetical protein